MEDVLFYSGESFVTVYLSCLKGNNRLKNRINILTGYYVFYFHDANLNKNGEEFIRAMLKNVNKKLAPYKENREDCGNAFSRF